MMKHILLFSFSVVLASASSAEFVGNLAQFQKEIVASPEAFAVEFYSEMCGSCKEFAPTWKKITTALHTQWKFVKIKVDTAAGRSIAEATGAFDGDIPVVKVYDQVGGSIKGSATLLADAFPAEAPTRPFAGRGGPVGTDGVRKLKKKKGHDEM